MNCKNCNSPVSSDDRFCPECGVAQPEGELTLQPEETQRDNPAEQAESGKSDMPAQTEEQVETEGEPPEIQALPDTPVPCGNCGAPTTDAAFCNACGSMALPAPAESKEPKMSSKARKTTVIIVAVVGLLVGGFFGGRAIYRLVKYNNAVALMTAESYAEAQEIFESLPEDYKEAAHNAEQCALSIRYNEAAALMAAGNYAEAEVIFQEIRGFRDASAQEQICRKHLIYAEAVDTLAAEDYYDAYALFTSIPGFQDSNDLAQTCLQPLPGTGILYRAEGFYPGSTQLRFRNNNNEYPRVYKVYKEDGTHVLTLFALPEETVYVWVPPGTYRINTGTGDLWFGEQDMFGDDGYYMKLRNSRDESELYQVYANYIITFYFLDEGEGEYQGNPYADILTFDTF